MGPQRRSAPQITDLIDSDGIMRARQSTFRCLMRSSGHLRLRILVPENCGSFYLLDMSNHDAPMFNSFTSRAYFSESERASVPSCSGVPPAASNEALVKFSRSVGSSSAFAVAVLSALIISAGRAYWCKQTEPGFQ